MNSALISFQEALVENRAMIGQGIDSVPAYIWKNVAEQHGLQVHCWIQDLFVRAASAVLKSPEAQVWMTSGVSTRLQMVRPAWKNILEVAGPKREEPLKLDQYIELIRDLNICYINLTGVLDNFAWMLVSSLEEDEYSTSSPQRVGLFTATFKKCERLKPLSLILGNHEDWFSDVLNRRHPSAHRIPLTIPHTALRASEVEDYHRAQDEYSSLLEGLPPQPLELSIVDEHRKKRKEARAKLDSIGSFVPMFFHHPKAERYKIYPTVPDDLVHTLQISNTVLDFATEQGFIQK